MTSAPASKSGGGLRYHRIVVKAGTAVLTNGTHRLSREAMERLAAQLARLHHRGAEVLLVSSGAVAAGREVLGNGEQRKDIPYRQALAAVGQSRLMHLYEEIFQSHGITVGQALLTRDDAEGRRAYLNIRNTLLSLLALRVLPIINENDAVAVEELGLNFGDNDRLSALVANVVEADLLVVLSDVQGLYTADPRVDPTATLVRRVERVDAAVEALAGRHRSATSRGGMPTKLEAARLATASGVAVVICDGREPDVVERAAAGEEVGTFFVPSASKLESRRRRLLALAPRGELVVDAGAVEALRQGHKSLLAAGVREVRGDFERGEAVYITGPGGVRVAVGQVNYPMEVVAKVKGQRSDRLLALVGEREYYGAEVVHRDHLVLL